MTEAPDAFAEALAVTLRYEGGKADHPADRGGRTAYGITQATYNAHRKGKPPRDVWGITHAEVCAIYRRGYWDTIRGDDIAASNRKFAICVFDAAVNHGVATSARMFQRTVHAEPDGVIGKVTVSCFRLRLMKLGESLLLETLLERRRGLYQAILLRDPTQKVFRNAWRTRLNDLCGVVGIEPVWEDV